MTTNTEPRTNSKSDFSSETDRVKNEINARFIKVLNALLSKGSGKKVTRRDLAEDLHMHYQTLSAIMNEREGNNATTANLAFACMRYKVNPEYVLLGEEPMFEGGAKSEVSVKAAPNLEADLRIKHLEEVNEHLRKANEEHAELKAELKEQIKYYKERLAKCEGA